MNDNRAVKLKLVDYQDKLSEENYKKLNIPVPEIMEIPANFTGNHNPLDNCINKIKTSKDIKFYGLHTQQPYTNGKGQALNLKSNQSYKYLIRGAQLWQDDDWVNEFVEFIKERADFIEEKALNAGDHGRKNGNYGLKYVEVHPPRESKKDDFKQLYEKFIERMNESFGGGVEVFMENSFNKYFMLYGTERIVEFLDMIRKSKYRSGIVLDIPQLLQSHELKCQYKDVETVEQELKKIFLNLGENRDLIRSIHLWGSKGKSNNDGKHNGDLNYIFYCNENRDKKISENPDDCNENGNDEISKSAYKLKKILLKYLRDLLDDGKERYLLLELNNNDPNQRRSIIKDLRCYGFEII